MKNIPEKFTHNTDDHAEEITAFTVGELIELLKELPADLDLVDPLLVTAPLVNDMDHACDLRADLGNDE